MSADEVTHGADADASRVRTGPRHAAPRKPLLARMHVPAGKAIALAAMPTAVLMGMGFTPTLARADEQPASKSLTADEYKACVDAMTAEASPSASPSASKSSADTKDASTSDSKDTTSKDTTSKDTDAGADSGSGGSSSSDSGSDDTAEPSPSPSSGAASSTDTSASSSDDTAAAEPSDTETSKNILETIGDAIKDVFDGDNSGDATATASPSPSASASESAADSGKDTSSGASKETTEKTEKTAKTSGTVKDAESQAAAAAADTADTATKDPSPSASASASPSPSASATTDVANCPVATDDVSGVDNKLPLPDDPWYLNASSLLLKDADYQGIVKVKTSSGKTKQVLKYVISGGIEIGDLHQTVIDKKAGKTYHVQARTGLPNSTIDHGDTVMYTESISGNLFGLIPVTFTPENPPPLNIPLIYFTNVKVQQAGQFGGTLTVPGLHQYTT
ncbi:hypothetical protein [Streptomyces sp. DSM 15324]|uniref:hypothetical protein n=1 Tax=Streptomyces sp. DSM 15324 TaxID=1739111 RepID=UPI0007481622|nr:hypothetical protein [Streptomyces sp. DSM 15324]KUO06746.1 hypothetical protein AQJ58_38855 [Streptomyces sp. DSM 15324]